MVIVRTIPLDIGLVPRYKLYFKSVFGLGLIELVLAHGERAPNVEVLAVMSAR